MSVLDDTKQHSDGNTLLKTLKEGKWEEGENICLDMLQSGISVPVFKEAIHEFWRRGQKDRAQVLLEQTIETSSSNNYPDLCLECFYLILKYNIPYKNFKNLFAEAFIKAHSECDYLELWIERVKKENLSPEDFAKTLDKLVLFKVGTIVKHRSGWGIGKITGIGAEDMAIFMDLENKPDHRMEAFAASECLRTVSPDNFEAMLHFNREELKKEAEGKPIELIYRLLKFVDRPVGAKDLKKYLCPHIIEDKDWSKWWTKVRKKMIVDSYIETSGAQGKYVLREEPLDWEEEVQKQFDSVASEEQSIFILDYLKNSSEKKRVSYFAKKLANVCEKFLQESPWYSLEAYLVVQELVKENSEKPEDLVEVSAIWQEKKPLTFANVRIATLAQETLNLFLEHVPDWEEHLTFIFQEGTDLARDTLLKHLKKSKGLKKHLKNIADSILNYRLSFPDALLWFSKQVMNDKFPNEEYIPSLIEMYHIMVPTTTSLKFMGRWDIDKATKFFTLSLGNKIGEAVEVDRAEDTINVTDSASWLTNNFRETLRLTIKERFPKLFSDVKPIFTTGEGLKKYEDEYRDLMENKIPENAKAIGEALSFGDISENAELDAARELQIQLTNKANDMKNNMKRAQLINFDEISDEKVAIGSVVTIESSKGESLIYTILGPWDVKVEDGIISYMSPIAEAMRGQQVEDEIDLPTGKYKIKAISKFKELL